jgi:hypothetical protein
MSKTTEQIVTEYVVNLNCWSVIHPKKKWYSQKEWNAREQKVKEALNHLYNVINGNNDYITINNINNEIKAVMKELNIKLIKIKNR